MFKLVTNRKFVRAVKRVMEELQAAGLKMNSDVRSLISCSWRSADLIFFFVLPQDALQEIMGLTQGPEEDS